MSAALRRVEDALLLRCELRAAAPIAANAPARRAAPRVECCWASPSGEALIKSCGDNAALPMLGVETLTGVAAAAINMAASN